MALRLLLAIRVSAPILRRNDLPVSLHTQRTPHPISSAQQALENHQSVCAVRGYCGPFINMDFYSAFPDPFWHGYGECLVCRSTCLVTAEEEKRRHLGRCEEPSGSEGALPPAPPSRLSPD